ncbi:Ig-like domain-containing protein [Lederbergia citrea]|uniref:Ig-like domain-containing protein n=1 Tax=Lederbergia citrea TaxID=2833581 RepID=UPI001BCA1D4B|nr:Ig-like domain-containing protein [Lederbergia citrea]MBS4178096.1 hypothetical protein [Lederbergia citrea]
MGQIRKILCIALTMLLFLPAFVHAKSDGIRKGEISASLKIDEGQQKHVKGDKEQYKKPSDYRLVKEGELIARLTDSQRTDQDFTYSRITTKTDDNSMMTLSLLYESDFAFIKDGIVSLEFFMENNGSMEYIGYLEFDLYGYYSATLNSYLQKKAFSNQQYIYVRLGVSENEDDEYYSAATLFKVKNPYYNGTPEPPSGDKYVLVSNESVVTDKTQSTGTFKINNDHYTLSKKLDMGAYKLDVNIPFDVKKHAAKKLESKSLIKSLNKIGDSKSFWTHNFATNKDSQITAKLVHVGSIANVWVHNNQITTADAKKLGDEFDKKIHPLITQYFAKESDVDGDGKINILCFDIQDGFSGSGGYVGGYFYGGDLFDMPNSNKSEIFYMDTYPSMGMGSSKDVTAVYDTLAHEFQHMVNFNQNVFVENGDPMDSWLNEGLSMAAEQIYTGKVLTDRINYYNIASSIANGHSLLYWDNAGDTLSNYSLSYLFTQYVRVQTNQGDKAFKEILIDKNNDYKSIENVVKKYHNSSMKFGKFMTNFRGALLLKEKQGVYGFKGETGFNTIQPRLFNGTSANLRGGGAVVKNTNNIDIPASKGNDITYTFFGPDSEKPEDPEDKTPPEKPTVYPVSDKDTVVTGKSEPAATVFVKAGSSTIGSGPVEGNGTFKVAINKQKAGTVLKVYAEDKAGNRSGEVNVTVLDKTTPEVPVVNEVTDKDTKVTGTAEPESTISVKVGTKEIGSTITGTDGKFTVSIAVQKAGTVLSVTAKDKAGNVSAVTKITVKDKTAPNTPTVSPVADNTKKISGTAEVGSTITVKNGIKVLKTAITDKAGKFTITLASTLKAGTILYVTATDKAGNVSNARKVTVLDKTAPNPPKVNKVTIKSTAVTGTAEANSTVYVKIGKKVIGYSNASKSGSFSVKIKKQKAGTILQVYAKEKAGNIGKATKTVVKTK